MKFKSGILLCVSFLTLSACGINSENHTHYIPDENQEEEHHYRTEKPEPADAEQHGYFCEFHQKFEKLENHTFVKHPEARPFAIGLATSTYYFNSFDTREVCSVCGYEKGREYLGSEIESLLQDYSVSEFKTKAKAFNYDTAIIHNVYTSNEPYMFKYQGVWVESKYFNVDNTFGTRIEKIKGLFDSVTSVKTFEGYYFAKISNVKELILDKEFRVIAYYDYQESFSQQAVFEYDEPSADIKAAIQEYKEINSTLTGFTTATDFMAFLEQERTNYTNGRLKVMFNYLNDNVDDESIYYRSGNYFAIFDIDVSNYSFSGIKGYAFNNLKSYHVDINEDSDFSSPTVEDTEDILDSEPALSLIKEGFDSLITNGYCVDHVENYPNTEIWTTSNGKYYMFQFWNDTTATIRGNKLVRFEAYDGYPSSYDDNRIAEAGFNNYDDDNEYLGTNRADMFNTWHPASYHNDTSEFIVNYDNTHHWFECPLCGEEFGKHTHNLTDISYEVEDNVEYRIDKCHDCEYQLKSINTKPKKDSESANIDLPTEAEVDASVAALSTIKEGLMFTHTLYTLDMSNPENVQVVKKVYNVNAATEVCLPAGDPTNLYVYGLNDGDAETYYNETGSTYYQHKKFLGRYNPDLSRYEYSTKSYEGSTTTDQASQSYIESNVNNMVNELKNRMYNVETFLQESYTGFKDADLSQMTYKYIDNGDGTYKCEISGYASKEHDLMKGLIVISHIVNNPAVENRPVIVVNFDDNGFITAATGYIEQHCAEMEYAYYEMANPKHTKTQEEVVPYLARMQFTVFYDLVNPVTKITAEDL